MSIEQVREAIGAAKDVPPPVEPPKDGGDGPPRDGGGDGDGPDDRALAKQPRNDIGNGRRLIARHGQDLIYVEEAGWYIWCADGKAGRWEATIGQRGGPGPEALKRAHATAEAIAEEAATLKRGLPKKPDPDDESPEAEEAREVRAAMLALSSAHYKFGIASGNAAKINGMLSAAAPYLRRKPQDLDSDPLLLNLANGTLDLRPEKPVLHDARRGDLMTHMSPILYDPEAVAQIWLDFLEEVLPDRDVRIFLQTWLGYSLTGLTDEQKLLLLYGTGANGKSVLINLIAAVLGDYAMTTPIETFLHNDRRGGGDATPELARLPGARVVTASEPETGARLAESVVKLATGGDTITARRLFEGQFEFRPCFKLMLSANIRPSIRGQDEGIWRRVILMPFEVFIPEERRDRRLTEKLRAEAPGILNWMVEGWRLYRQKGLIVPDAMRAATDLYRAESDPIREFLSMRTRPAPHRRITAKALYDAYAKWAKDNAFEAISPTAFGRKVSAAGMQREKIGIMFYRDIELIPEDAPDGSGQSDGSEGDLSAGDGPGGPNDDG